MKGIFLTILLSALASSFTLAQDKRFGFKAGVNLATNKIEANGTTFTPSRAVKARIGFFYEKMLNDKWAVQLEALYSGTGYKPESGSGINRITINYLAFPALIKYYFTEKLNLHSGIEPGLFVGGKADDLNISDGVKTLDLGAAIGAEYAINNNIALNARYTLGLINTDGTRIPGQTKKTNNIEITIMVSVR